MCFSSFLNVCHIFSNGTSQTLIHSQMVLTVNETERQTETDGQRQTETDRDRQRQTETDRDRQRQTETDRQL